MYINTIDNRTIKYESVVGSCNGDGVAYKRFFRPVSPCKITGNLFADLRRSVVDGSHMSGVNK